MTDAVAERVLRGSYTQTQALSLARFQAPAMLDVHDRFMRDLEASGRLDRAIEMLPDADAIAERRQAGQGLTQPELAVLLAYSKITLYAALLDSDLPDDPALEGELAIYFPPPLPERYADEMAPPSAAPRDHRHAGGEPARGPRGDDVHVPPARGHGRVARRHRARVGDRPRRVRHAHAVVGGRGARRRRDRRHADVDAAQRRAGWSSARRAGCCARGRGRWTSAPRWRASPTGRARWPSCCPDVLVDSERQAWQDRVAGLTDAGVPEALAARVASQGALFSALDIVEVAGATERGVEEVAGLHFELGGKLHLHWLRDQIALLTRDTRWATMARAALRDDLFSLHADLTREVLRFDSLDAWFEANRAAVERAQEILGEIRAGGAFDLTTLPVALREVRNLIAPAGRT